MNYDYGAMRETWLTHLITDWMGDDAWLWKLSCQHRKFIQLQFDVEFESVEVVRGECSRENPADLIVVARHAQFGSRTPDGDIVNHDVPLLELFVRIGDPVERIGCGDIEIDCARNDQVGDFAEHRRCRRLGATFGLRADLGGFLEGDDGVDALRRHAEVDGELNIVRSEQIDERIDAIRCGIAQSLG